MQIYLFSNDYVPYITFIRNKHNFSKTIISYFLDDAYDCFMVSVVVIGLYNRHFCTTRKFHRQMNLPKRLLNRPLASECFHEGANNHVMVLEYCLDLSAYMKGQEGGADQ